MKKTLLFSLMSVLLAGFGFVGVSFADSEIDISSCSIIGLKEDSTYLFSGVAVTPTVWVVCVDESLEEPDKYYTVDQEYYDILYTDNDRVGTAKITVTGKNGYTGTLEKTFKLLLDDSVVYTVYTPLTDKYTYNFVDPTADKFNSGGPIKLYKDVTLNKSIAGSMLGGNKTVDLNGHSITVVSGSPFISATKNTKEWTFNIIDTSENKGGKIIVSNSENAILVNRKNMNLTIGEGVIIEGGKIKFSSENGSITLQGKFTEDVTELTNEGYYSVYDGEQYYEVTNDIGTLISFFMSSNFGNAEFKVILNEEGNSIDLWRTKAYLEKTLTDDQKAASTLYQLLKNATSTNGIEVIEVAGEKLLFVNNITESRTDVFRNSTSGKFNGDAFLPSKATEYPVEGLLYGEIVKPSWITNVTPDKYNEVKAGETIIGYILHTVDNGWFYAPKTYKITFDVGGGEGNYEPQFVLLDGKAIKPETDPTKKGYILLGWFNGDDKFDFESPVTSNLALTAKWEAMTSSGGAKIDDETDEGTGMVVEADVPATETAASAVQSSNSTATVQGEVELNVYNDADGSGTPDDPSNPISSKVNFTKVVLVRIPVASGLRSVKVKVKHNGDSTFGTVGLTTSSTATCNNGVSDVPYNGGDIAVTSGYVEIYTCSASTFVAYTEVANPTSSSSTSGGGGGGSSSYSCKSLPANAVANNASKPKKNTNYSYSTDTGAVCTFQCKSGYTWNEKDEKCEKSVADTDKQDTEKLESDATDTDNETFDTTSEDLKKVLDDGYNVEFHNAYNFAFKNGITTMPNVQAADMNSPLTRIAMAKMLSQYAINVLGKKPANVVVPNFPDVSPELDAEYNNGVTLAYQLGIMGINIENFRPDDLVTRAEFATALSRLLYNTSDGEGAYYETHLEKLMEEKIITVDDPNMHELRGYVMIMLMRSAKNN